MKRLAVIVLVAVGAAGVAVAATLYMVRDTSGPSRDDRSACAALRDIVADRKGSASAEQVARDVDRFAHAANRGDNDRLIHDVNAARSAMIQFVDLPDTAGFAGEREQVWQRVRKPLRSAATECQRIGLGVS